MSESRTPTSTPFMKGSSYDRIRKTRSSNCSTSSRDFVAYSGPSSPRAARPTTPCRRRSDDVESAGQRTIRRIRPSSARTDRCPRCSCGGRVVDELHAISRAIMSRYFSVAGSSGANNLLGDDSSISEAHRRNFVRRTDWRLRQRTDGLCPASPRLVGLMPPPWSGRRSASGAQPTSVRVRSGTHAETQPCR